jgi:hypothetical protein
MLKRFDIKLSTLFIFLFMVALLNGYLFIWLNETFFHYENQENGLSGFSKTWKFILIVVVAPFMETYVFQYLPNVILRKMNIRNNMFLIIIPSLLFGCAHFYSWIYVMMAFLGGIFINLLYVYAKSTSNHYFLVVTGFHALYNLYGFVFVV